MKPLANWLRAIADRLDPTTVQQAGNIIEDYMRRAVPTLTDQVSNAELVSLTDRGAEMMRQALIKPTYPQPISHDAAAAVTSRPESPRGSAASPQSNLIDRGAAAVGNSAERSPPALGPPLSTLHAVGGAEGRAARDGQTQPPEATDECGDSRRQTTQGSAAQSAGVESGPAAPRSNVARIHATKPTTFSRRKSRKPKPDPGEAA